MQAVMPFFEGVEDALRAAVQHCGGAKAVGLQLWPDRSADEAGRRLLDCLNPNRPEKLEASQVMRIFKMARAADFDAPFTWFAQDCGYEAKAICPAEEEDRILSVITDSTKTLSLALNALERLKGTTPSDRAVVRVGTTTSQNT